MRWVGVSDGAPRGLDGGSPPVRSSRALPAAGATPPTRGVRLTFLPFLIDLRWLDGGGVPPPLAAAAATAAAAAAGLSGSFGRLVLAFATFVLSFSFGDAARAVAGLEGIRANTATAAASGGWQPDCPLATLLVFRALRGIFAICGSMKEGDSFELREH